MPIVLYEINVQWQSDISVFQCVSTVQNLIQLIVSKTKQKIGRFTDDLRLKAMVQKDKGHGKHAKYFSQLC